MEVALWGTMIDDGDDGDDDDDDEEEEEDEPNPFFSLSNILVGRLSNNWDDVFIFQTQHTFYDSDSSRASWAGDECKWSVE